jgi:preprotein translocase SecF subunit
VAGEEAEVKTFGANNELLVRLAASGRDGGELGNQIETVLKQKFPEANAHLVKSDVVGPRIASDMYRGAFYAVIASLIVIFFYILVRYEWRFGVGAVVATFHDVIITLGLFSLLHKFVPINLQIDQTIIAAFLTIVGFSLNDTVIVFDRVRENIALHKNETFQTLMNRAMNSTLSRTIITSLTVLMSAFVLFFLGGEVLRGFAFAMIVGVAFGTYSSVYVASAVVLELKNHEAARAKK